MLELELCHTADEESLSCVLPARQADFSVYTVKVLVFQLLNMTGMVTGLHYMVAATQSGLTVPPK